MNSVHRHHRPVDGGLASFLALLFLLHPLFAFGTMRNVRLSIQGGFSWEDRFVRMLMLLVNSRRGGRRTSWSMLMEFQILMPLLAILSRGLMDPI